MSSRIGPGGAASALFLCLLWGGLLPAIKVSLEGFQPLALAAARFAIALASLWLWCKIRGIPWRISHSRIPGLLLFSLIFTAQIATVNLGARFTKASYVVVLVNTSPLFVALMAHWLLPGDRMTFSRIIGLISAFLGVSLIFLTTAPDPAMLTGNLLALASGFLLAGTHVFSKRLVSALEPVKVVFWQFAFAVPIFILLSVLAEPLEVSLPPRVILALLFQGVVVGTLCFVGWTVLLKKHSATQLVSFQFTIPVFGVLLSSVILDEAISGSLIAGLPLVATGIFLVTRPEKVRLAAT